MNHFAAKMNRTIDVAVKFEPTSATNKCLSKEYDMYKALGATADDYRSELHGISRIYYFGIFLKPFFNILVMDVFDQNLYQLYKRFNRQFTRETVLLIFLQTVDILIKS